VSGAMLVVAAGRICVPVGVGSCALVVKSDGEDGMRRGPVSGRADTVAAEPESLWAEGGTGRCIRELPWPCSGGHRESLSAVGNAHSVGPGAFTGCASLRCVSFASDWVDRMAFLSVWRSIVGLFEFVVED
jgi:hypothetical protein